MSESTIKIFNPCLLPESDQIPAKIWELLRRNTRFRKALRRLIALYATAKEEGKRTRDYHGAAWTESYNLIKRIAKTNPFAAVALQWLVPEPLFHYEVVTRPRDKRSRSRGFGPLRTLRAGHGITPNHRSRRWVWRRPGTIGSSTYPLRRGPEVFVTKSRVKILRDRVDPILEYRRYHWPFTVNHSWSDSPKPFQRQFLFLWRRYYDSRPKNPITKDRSDSPSPHEITFFHDWNLAHFKASGHPTRQDLAQVIHFSDIASDYRVFAIPKTILTKASADEMGKWLTEILKKGSDLYGDLLDGKLLNESEMLGITTEWTDWLPRDAGVPNKAARGVYYYRRCRYMKSLVQLAFPKFQINKLLAHPSHRARGKPYVRKK